MELKDTVELMNSSDYQDRFKAEYYQLETRINKLEKMLIKYEAKTLDFEPSCPIEHLQDQLYYMKEYMRVLKIRVEVEGIEIENTDAYQEPVHPEIEQGMAEDTKSEIKRQVMEEISQTVREEMNIAKKELKSENSSNAKEELPIQPEENKDVGGN